MLNPFVLLPLLAASPSMTEMKWDRRVLIVAAPNSDDAALLEQRRIMSAWKVGAEERDLVVVEVIADRVAGASDSVAVLRQRYRLPPRGFAVVLVGKDGGSKLREGRPVSAELLKTTIDAMPMRRAGER